MAGTIEPPSFSLQAFHTAASELSDTQEFRFKEKGCGLATSRFDRFLVRVCNFVYFRSLDEIAEQKTATWNVFLTALASELVEPESSIHPPGIRFESEEIASVMARYSDEKGGKVPLTKRVFVDLTRELEAARTARLVTKASDRQFWAFYLGVL